MTKRAAHVVMLRLGSSMQPLIKGPVFTLQTSTDSDEGVLMLSTFLHTDFAQVVAPRFLL